MKNALILIALNALLVQYDLFPLPPELVAANKNPAGTVSASVGHSLPYVVRANVSEFGVPRATDEDNNRIPNPHIVATTFDLTYTGSSALNSSYAGIEGNSSAVTGFWTVMYDFNASQSVLDSYDANSPGDCSKPLGAACVHALTQHPLKDYESRGLHLGVPECADVLGTLRDQVENYEGNDVVSQVNPLYANLTDGPFFWRASAAFSGHSRDALDEELSKLQLVGLTADIEDISSGEMSKVTSVMCFRVGGKAVTGGSARVAPSIAAALVGIAAVWILI